MTRRALESRPTNAVDAQNAIYGVGVGLAEGPTLNLCGVVRALELRQSPFKEFLSQLGSKARQPANCEPENRPRGASSGFDATANFVIFQPGPRTSAHGASSGQPLPSVG
jgi:hypothetical protein